LIILLFDAAESAMHQGLACIESGDINGRSNALMKAIDIILSGLTASLNIEEGGELAQNLKALYDYIVSRLIYANIHQDPAAIKEAQKLLGEISGLGGKWGKT
jgi:flagellar protein FliS